MITRPHAEPARVPSPCVACCEGDHPADRHNHGRTEVPCGCGCNIDPWPWPTAEDDTPEACRDTLAAYL